MPTPQQEIDIYTRMMEQRKAELMRDGASEEQAEDQACAEIRRSLALARQPLTEDQIIQAWEEGYLACPISASHKDKTRSAAKSVAAAIAAAAGAPVTPSDTEARMREILAEEMGIECPKHGPLDPYGDGIAEEAVLAAMLRARNEAIEKCEKILQRLAPVGGRVWDAEQMACFALIQDALTAIRQLKGNLN